MNTPLPYLPLASPLHDPGRLLQTAAPFLREVCRRAGLEMSPTDPLSPVVPSLIYVQSGGTEAGFRALGDRIPSPAVLLTHPAENSLPAALEILTWLRERSLRGVIIHGSPAEAASLLGDYATALAAAEKLRTARLGLVGAPSDWLIANRCDPELVRERWGCRVIAIPLSELVLPGPVPASPEAGKGGGLDPGTISQARALTGSLQALVGRHRLDGLTLRCFDLLPSWGNTGCLGLSELNDLAIPAACEGDVPALFTMALVRFLTGSAAFMANPSSWRDSELVLAHCTVPLSLVEEYSLDTHFESGRGVGIRGRFRPGPCLLVKVAGADLSRIYISRGELGGSPGRGDLCRTQVVVRPEGDFGAYLEEPLGNHLIVVPGEWGGRLEAFRRLYF